MSEPSRRKLLKALAAGSGAIVAGKHLPTAWSRPVVDAVMLPAHARASMRSYTSVSSPIAMAVTPNRMTGLAESLLPQARAGPALSAWSIDACIQGDPDGSVQVDARLNNTATGDAAIFTYASVPGGAP